MLNRVWRTVDFESVEHLGGEANILNHLSGDGGRNLIEEAVPLLVVIGEPLWDKPCLLGQLANFVNVMHSVLASHNPDVERHNHLSNLSWEHVIEQNQDYSQVVVALRENLLPVLHGKKVFHRFHVEAFLDLHDQAVEIVSIPDYALRFMVFFLLSKR